MKKLSSYQYQYQFTVERQARFKRLKIFLPRVLHRQGDGEYRPLDYDRDILAGMDWESLRYRMRDECEPEEQDYLQETQARMDVTAAENGHTTDADPLLKKRNGEPLERYLFEKVYQKDFDEELEKPVAWYLDGQNAVKWWHRLVARQDYYVQGWQRQRVYPDFLACVQETGNGFRFTVLETKGRQLKGNDDTEYKRQLFDVLTEYYEHVVDAVELELDLGENKMLFKMLLQDTWEADVRESFA